jgi:hypothetical protein
MMKFTCPQTAAVAVGVVATLAPSMGWPQANYEERLFQARVLGLPGASPLGQSVAGNELGGRLDDTNARAAFEKYLKTAAKASPSNLAPDSPEAVRNAVLLIEKPRADLAATQRNVDQERIDLEGFSDAKDAFMTGGGGAGGRRATGFLMGAELAANLYIRYNTKKLDATLVQANAEYERSVSNIFDYALNTLSPADYAKARQLPTLSQENQKAEMQKLFGNASVFLQPNGIGSFTEPEKKVLIEKMLPSVASGIARVEAARKGDALRVAELERKGKEGAEKVTALTVEFRVYKRTAEQQMFDVKALAENTNALASAYSKQLTAIKGDVQNARLEVGDLQRVLYGTLSPAQQLEALNSPTFLPHLLDREDVKKRLGRVVDITNRRDTLLKTFEGVGAGVQLASMLGLPIDAYKVNRGLTFATSVTVAWASFAMSDWMGGAKAVSGAIGALMGGKDAEAERHKEMMEALMEVLKLQRLTLEKLDALSAQLATTTAELEAGQRMLNAKIEAGFWVDDLLLCGEFMNSAQAAPYKMSDGVFASYKLRQSHFYADASTGNSKFGRCASLISKLANIDPAPGGNKNYAKPMFWASETDPTARGSVNEYYEYTYEPFLRFVEWRLTLDPNTPCADRVLGGLGFVPRTVSEAKDAFAFNCKNDGAAVEGLRGQGDGAPKMLRYANSVVQPLHAARVAQFGQYLLFLAPYYEFIVEPGVWTKGMLAEEDVVAGKFRSKAAEDAMTNAEAWSRQYLDVVHVALAQQALLAGTPVLQQSLQMLKEAKYGFADPTAVARYEALKKVRAKTISAEQMRAEVQSEVDKFATSTPRGKDLIAQRKNPGKEVGQADGCKVTPRSLNLESGRAVLMCLVQHYPIFGRNLATALIRDTLLTHPSGNIVETPRYELARTNPKGLMPFYLGHAGLGADQLIYQDGQWVMRWLAPDGQPLDMPLPSGDELSAGGPLAYPESTAALRRLEGRLRDLNAAARTVLPGKGFKKPDGVDLPSAWAGTSSLLFVDVPTTRYAAELK